MKDIKCNECGNQISQHNAILKWKKEWQPQETILRNEYLIEDVIKDNKENKKEIKNGNIICTECKKNDLPFGF